MCECEGFNDEKVTVRGEIDYPFYFDGELETDWRKRPKILLIQFYKFSTAVLFDKPRARALR